MIPEYATHGFASAGLSALRRLLADDSGQGLVEYALIITFTALLCLVGLRFLGAKVNNTLYNAANSLS
ncbi:MAG: Flp family type IVb pilin [Vulcanimicrobiaceae bacterium]